MTAMINVSADPAAAPQATSVTPTGFRQPWVVIVTYALYFVDDRLLHSGPFVKGSAVHAGRNIRKSAAVVKEQ